MNINGLITSLALVTFMSTHVAAGAESRTQGWPPHGEGLQADEGVLYGVLDNGLRYAIVRNPNPPRTATFVLRIGVGSIHEADSERGLAHFLEHMSYNGSAHFEPGTTTQTLHRAGLRHRALTDFDNTTYSLSASSTDPLTIETAFKFLQDVGFGMLLSQEAIDREKETILSELRLRDVPENRANDRLWRLLQRGMLAADRIQGGDEEIVRGARRAQLVEFYRKFYRPERSIFVAVGDFEPKQIETSIAGTFDDWSQPGPPGEQPSLGSIRSDSTSTDVFVHPGVLNRLTIAWPHPAGLTRDSAHHRGVVITRRIALGAINRRFARLSSDPRNAVLQAGAFIRELPYAAGAAGLTITPRKGDFRHAAESVLRELERARRYPLFQSEVDREIELLRRRYRNALVAATSRSTSDTAADLAERLFRDRVFTTPAFDRELFETVVATASKEAIRDAAVPVFSGSDPLIFVSSQRPLKAQDTDYLSSLPRTARTEDVASPVEIPSKTFDFRPGTRNPSVASRAEVAAVGTTLVTYQNRVALTIKPTTFAKERVEVSVRLGGGMRVLPAGRPGLARALQRSFIAGGLESLDEDELAEALTGRTVSYTLTVTDDSFLLSGYTTNRDLELQLKILAAFLTEPGFNPDALTRAQEWFKLRQNDISSDPVELFENRLPALVRSGDDRWESPSPGAYASIGIGDLRHALDHSLKRGPIEITIVGDVSADQAIAAVASSFATLPDRDSIHGPTNGARDHVRYPGEAMTVCWHHAGRADQALAGVIWPATSEHPHPRLARTLQLIGASFKRAMFDQIVKEGLSYRTMGADHLSSTFQGFGYMPTAVDVRPEQVDRVISIMDAFVARWRSGDIDGDLLSRVRKSTIDARRLAREANGFWSWALRRAQSKPETLDAIASELSDLQSISQREIASAASVYFDPSRRIQLRILPKGCPPRHR